MPRSRAADNWPSLSPNAAGGRTLSTVFGECSRRSLVRQMTSEYVAGLLRYDLKLWVGHSHEGAAYLPR
jgi:hypothetical protein